MPCSKGRDEQVWNAIQAGSFQEGVPQKLSMLCSSIKLAFRQKTGWVDFAATVKKMRVGAFYALCYGYTGQSIGRDHA